MITVKGALIDNIPRPVGGPPLLPKGRAYLRSVIHELVGAFCLETGTRPSVRYGWDVVAILFEDKIVVRLPKTASAWMKMQREEIVLGRIAPMLPYPVPLPQTMTTPCRLSVHRMIQGRNLSQSVYRSLSRARKGCLAEQLAELFLALHAIPPSLFGFSVQQSVTGVTLTDTLHRIGTEQKWQWLHYLEKPLTKGFARWPEFHDQAVFSHFDLQGSNILVDPKTTHISGIVDFLDCGMGSKFYDMSKVSKIDVGLMERVWRLYRNRAEMAAGLIQLLAAYGILEQLSDILIREISPAKATRRMTRVQKLVELLKD